ncbi:MAG: ABC transporter permease, partial [Bacteroidales bacterium]|nr:ABC transporter permease [Bacteroidales bacterium]
MNLPFYIARRYLISKKSRNLINLISGISMAGIMIGTMALILVLSFFNGLDSLIKSLFSAFDPEIKITLAEGKTFKVDSKVMDEVRNDPSVAVYCEVLEENALLKYGQQQAVATIKGVQNNFSELTGIDSLITDGKFLLYENEQPMAIVGYDLAYRLSIGLSFLNPLFIFVPKRNTGFFINPANAFRQEHLYPSGVFSVQQEYDSRYVILPISFVRELLQYDKEASAIELKLVKGTDTNKVKKRFGALLGKDFKIQDRFEQH